MFVTFMNEDISIPGLVTLFKQAPKLTERLYMNINLDDTNLTIEDIDEEDSVCVLIGEALAEITGYPSFCGFVMDSDEAYGESESCIMFVEKMPYNYTDAEKKLTEKDLKEIFHKYLTDVISVIEIC